MSRDEGELEAAEGLYREAWRAVRRSYSPDSVLAAEIRGDYSRLLRQIGKDHEAERIAAASW